MIEWYYFALLSSVMLGIYSLIEKKALKKEHATAFSSAFSFVAALISLPFILLANFSMTPLHLVLIFINGIIIALTYLLAARIYRHGSISAAAGPFSALPSLFVAVLAFIFLGEELSMLQYVSIIMIALVIYVLLFEKRSGKDFDNNKYRTMIFTRCFLVAIEAVLTKYILGSVNVYAFFVLSELFVAFDFAIFISLKYNGVKEIIETTRIYFVPILSMALLTAGYGLTYYLSLQSADASLVTPVRNTLYVAITVIAGGILFKEKNLKMKLALAAVLLLFAYLLIA